LRIVLSLLLLLPLSAQDRVPARRFEVTSIKPNTSGFPNSGAEPFTFSPSGLFVANNVTLVDIIVSGTYQTRRIQMRGGPDWIDSARWDISAKADTTGGQIGREEWPVMLRALLEDRFKLALHRENQEMQVYALVAGKEPKLKRSEPGERSGFSRTANGGIELRANPIQGLANTLSNFLREPVIDATGIPGFFDMTVDWPRYILNTGGQQRVDREEMASAVRSAVEEQLGLKMERRKAPLEVTVIDRAEKPGEN
jgi:uncharacterized protein (TIGR03435 family)